MLRTAAPRPTHLDRRPGRSRNNDASSRAAWPPTKHTHACLQSSSAASRVLTRGRPHQRPHQPALPANGGIHALGRPKDGSSQAPTRVRNCSEIQRRKSQNLGCQRLSLKRQQSARKGAGTTAQRKKRQSVERPRQDKWGCDKS
eukprot:6212517-Pleurochrysis_carterae.AAC.10